jgi:hypothetical protein
MMLRRFSLLALCLIALAAAAACDPLAPIPTPTAVVLIVSPEASATLPANHPHTAAHGHA